MNARLNTLACLIRWEVIAYDKIYWDKVKNPRVMRRGNLGGGSENQCVLIRILVKNYRIMNTMREIQTQSG